MKIDRYPTSILVFPFVAALFLIGSMHSVDAQLEDDEYHPWLDGYVIIQEGDTLFGEIRNAGASSQGTSMVFGLGEGIVRIRTVDTKAQKDFAAEDVLGYFIDGQTYHSKEVKKKWKFLRLLSSEKANLYEGYHSNPKYSNLIGSSGQFQENIYSGADTRFYMIEKGDVFEIIRRVGFRKEIIKFFVDDEKLCEAIKKKQLKYQSILLIVDLYNGIKEW